MGVLDKALLLDGYCASSAERGGLNFICCQVAMPCGAIQDDAERRNRGEKHQRDQAGTQT
jgi:hypothetical protein